MTLSFLLAFQLLVANLCFIAAAALPLAGNHAQFVSDPGYQEAPGPHEIDSKVAISDLVAVPKENSGYGDASELLDKRQSFNPWGGKRSDVSQDLMKRAFNPWGGKRGFNPWGGKRAFNPWGGKRAFSPWGGKRSPEEEGEEHKRAFNPWGGKRAFNPWGGKRSEDPANTDEDKRAFNPWGGKRSEGQDEEKRAFNPWGGKRAFNPWGGKRSQEGEDKRSFNPWGGKRSDDKRSFSPWGGKRSEMDDKRAFNPWGGKRAFNPWGGKRSADVHLDSEGGHHIVKRNADAGPFDGYSKEDLVLAHAILEEMEHLQQKHDEETKRAFNPWGGKKRAFNPWGGKRSFSPWGGKREFNPWGGKRAADDAEGREYVAEDVDELTNHPRYARDTAHLPDLRRAM